MNFWTELLRQLPGILGSAAIFIGALAAAWANLKGRIAENTAEVVRGNDIAAATKAVADKTKAVADSSHDMMNSRLDQFKAETAAAHAAAMAAAALLAQASITAAYKQGILDAKTDLAQGPTGPAGPQGEKGEPGGKR